MHYCRKVHVTAAYQHETHKSRFLLGRKSGLEVPFRRDMGPGLFSLQRYHFGIEARLDDYEKLLVLEKKY